MVAVDVAPDPSTSSFQFTRYLSEAALAGEEPMIRIVE
jgi:hypothetical protein